MVHRLTPLAGPPDAPGPADRAALAAWWLRLMHPLRQRHRRVGRRPFMLRNLRRDLLTSPLATDVLRTVRDEALEAPPIERRVAAAIIGVPGAG